MNRRRGPKAPPPPRLTDFRVERQRIVWKKDDINRLLMQDVWLQHYVKCYGDSLVLNKLLSYMSLLWRQRRSWANGWDLADLVVIIRALEELLEDCEISHPLFSTDWYRKVPRCVGQDVFNYIYQMRLLDPRPPRHFVPPFMKVPPKIKVEGKGQQDVFKFVDQCMTMYTRRYGYGLVLWELSQYLSNRLLYNPRLDRSWDDMAGDSISLIILHVQHDALGLMKQYVPTGRPYFFDHRIPDEDHLRHHMWLDIEAHWKYARQWVAILLPEEDRLCRW